MFARGCFLRERKKECSGLRRARGNVKVSVFRFAVGPVVVGVARCL